MISTSFIKKSVKYNKNLNLIIRDSGINKCNEKNVFMKSMHN